MSKIILTVAVALSATSAFAQETAAQKAGEIATQPVRDVGIDKKAIPPVLVAAGANAYGVDGLTSCAKIGAAIADLTAVLGPDFGTGEHSAENRAEKIAEAGGKTVVNTVIPFRGLVREISGAAPAERRMNAALDAGYARRGFLRGLYLQRSCKPAL
jgi:hypothetical protein